MRYHVWSFTCTVCISKWSLLLWQQLPVLRCYLVAVSFIIHPAGSKWVMPDRIEFPAPQVSSSCPAPSPDKTSINGSTRMAVHVLLTHLIKLNKGCEGEKGDKNEIERGRFCCFHLSPAGTPGLCCLILLEQECGLGGGWPWLGWS